MQSKDGPLRVHRMNSKLQNRKLTDRRTMKNDHRIDHRIVTEAPRPWFFFFFLLLLTNFTQNLLISYVGPFSSAPSCLFTGNEGWRLCNSLPRQAGCFIPKLSSGPRGWKMSPKWPFCPFFEHFAHFLPKRHETLRIVRQLVLSSSIWLARIQTFANDHPRTKLGYENYSFQLKRINFSLVRGLMSHSIQSLVMVKSRGFLEKDHRKLQHILWQSK